jgi:pyruvate dehydrogenase E2 component (dihydrolipoamide acetyltransferase)
MLMAKYITMPKLGLTMKEGKLTKWYVAEGMEFKTGDALYALETDKLANDIEAAENGFMIKHLLQEGENAPCLTPVAIIGNMNEDISELLKASGKEEIAEEPKESKKSGRIIASPAAKRLASERGIKIEDIIGSGPDGRITVDDVEAYGSTGKAKKSTPMASKIADKYNVSIDEINKSGRITKQDVLDHVSKEKETRMPMTAMRKIIAARMTESWHTSPVVHYNIRVDMTNIKKMKDELKSEINLTYTDILVKITSKALLDFPLLNSSVEGEEIVLRSYVNMGVAVALEEGLIVPVVRNAHLKGLKEISGEIRDLAEKARNNGLSIDDIEGGTFTITNIGMFGVESFTPIINQPEVAILGITAIVDTVVNEGSGFATKPLMNLSLTADHRAVDGAVAAGFLSHLKKMIEKPSMLLL